MSSGRIKRPLVVFIDYILHKKDQEYYSDDSHILFTQAIQSRFTTSVLCSRTLSTDVAQGHKVDTETTSVQALPYYPSLVSFWKRIWVLLPRTIRRIKSQITDESVLWLAWPHPISLVLLLLYGKRNKVFITVRQNLKALMKVRYTGPTRILAIFMVDFLNLVLRLFYKNILVLTTGREMYRMLNPIMSNVHEVKTPVVSKGYKQQYVYDNSDEINLLFVGRLEPEKGLKYLVESVALLKRRGLNVKLNIVGNGAEWDSLQSQVKEKKLEGVITFHGYLPFGDQLLAHYASASYFILPSISEGFPKVINEARAFGLPIITTKCGGVVHEIEHEVNGYFIDKKSPESIVNAVCHLYKSPELRQKISRNEHADFDENNMEYHQERMLNILKTQLFLPEEAPFEVSPSL